MLNLRAFLLLRYLEHCVQTPNALFETSEHLVWELRTSSSRYAEQLRRLSSEIIKTCPLFGGIFCIPTAAQAVFLQKCCAFFQQFSPRYWGLFPTKLGNLPKLLRISPPCFPSLRSILPPKGYISFFIPWNYPRKGMKCLLSSLPKHNNSRYLIAKYRELFLDFRC